MTKKLRLREPKQCASFRAGHGVHWIQGLRYVPQMIEVPAKVVHLAGSQFQVLTDNGIYIYTWFHHDPERLIEAIRRAPEESIHACPDDMFIKVRDAEGDYLFSMSRDPLAECSI